VPADRDWLAEYTAELVRSNASIRAIEQSKLAIDKQARALEVKWIKRYLRRRPRLIKELDKRGIFEKDWCRTLGRGFSYDTIMARLRLYKGYDRYLAERAKVGDNGYYGLKYAAYLARPEKAAAATSLPPGQTLIAAETAIDPDHQFIIGQAHLELRKMPSSIIQCCVTSPPYWPARRLYNEQADGTFLTPTQNDIGFEQTWEEYLGHVVRRDFHELQRVMRPDGTVFVVLDDVIANPSSIYGEQRYHDGRAIQNPAQINLKTQDTTKMRPKGNWLDLPAMFAAAMMDDGWFQRDKIIWDKGSLGRKESTDSRCRHNYETILMFTLTASGYWYNQDALRIPLSGGNAYTVRGYGISRRKPGVLRRDGEQDGGDRDFRAASNPLGRVHDAVWHIAPVNAPHGSHSAAFPEELVRRCFLLGVPPIDMAPISMVLDHYGGTGTVSAVAKRMGLKSKYIDSNPVYAAEAQARVQGTKPEPDTGVANDNYSSVEQQDEGENQHD
jgi:DNA modification methylase